MFVQVYALCCMTRLSLTTGVSYSRQTSLAVRSNMYLVALLRLDSFNQTSLL